MRVLGGIDGRTGECLYCHARTGKNGYRSGESKQQLLARLPHYVGDGRGVGTEPADSTKRPWLFIGRACCASPSSAN